jgi:putative membrane protein
MLGLLLAAFVGRAHAHQGLVLPWDPDDIDYAQASPDAWLALDLHVSVLLGTLAFWVLYHRAVTTWRVRYGWSEVPVERWRAVCFGVAQVILLLALNGPVHHLSDYYLFSGHMVQHLMLTLMWAPLTVVALPPWLVEAGLRVPVIRRVSDWTADLRVKFLVANGVLYFWHIPTMYDLALEVHEVHVVEHLSFMASSIIAWVGLLCSAPSLPRPSRIFQLVYLFGMTLPMKLLGAILTLASEPIYGAYLEAPRIWGLTPILDQGYGGLLMWLPGGMALWGSMIYVFVQWVKDEQATRVTPTVEGAS